MVQASAWSKPPQIMVLLSTVIAKLCSGALTSMSHQQGTQQGTRTRTRTDAPARHVVHVATHLRGAVEMPCRVCAAGAEVRARELMWRAVARGPALCRGMYYSAATRRSALKGDGAQVRRSDGVYWRPLDSGCATGEPSMLSRCIQTRACRCRLSDGGLHCAPPADVDV